MNRRKATLIAAGATFLVLTTGIVAGGFFGGATPASSQNQASDTAIAPATSPSRTLVVDNSASPAPAFDQRSRRDADDEDRSQTRRNESHRGADRQDDGHREGDE